MVVDMPWWIGLALTLLGLLLVVCTTIFDLPLLPGRLRPYAYWLGLAVFLLGVALEVVFT
jgi:hypothetical protein